MTLVEYQRALTDMIAAPELCLHVRSDPDVALRAYDLSAREHRRLVTVARQPGMSTSCTLHRVNRMTPIFSYLPLTCGLLGDGLMREVELFWATARPADLQFGPETERFANFLRGRLQSGELRDPYVDEVLGFELAANRLQANLREAHGREIRGHVGRSDDGAPRAALHPHVAIVPFRHDPLPLLQALAERGRPEREPLVGEFFLALDVTGQELKLSQIEPDTARTLVGG